MGAWELFNWWYGETRTKLEELERRWNALYAWGLKEKLPNTRVHWEAWEDYDKLLDQDELEAGLNAQIAELNAVEREARDHGYAAPPPLLGVDIEQSSPGHSAASTVDQAGKKLEHVLDEHVFNFPWKTVGLVFAGGLVAVGVVGLFTAKAAAPYVIPVATGGAVTLRRGDERT